MTDSETPAETAARLIREAKMIAADLPFEERANLLRGVTHSVREATKDELSTGGAPQGKDWELDRLDEIHQVTEDYWHDTLEEKRKRQQ